MVFTAGCPPPHFDSLAPRSTAAATKIRKYSRAVLAQKFEEAGHEPGTMTLSQLVKKAPKLDPPVPVSETYTTVTHTFSRDELAAKINESHPALDTSLQDTAQLKKWASSLNPAIPLSEKRPAVTTGFEGKQKGLMQVLWERGFIDPNNVSKYHKDYDDKLGEAEEQPYCLRWLMARCPDFMEEETQMTFVMNKLGVEVEMSPKCHPELAGQGIEYNWGKSKKYFRRERTKKSPKISEVEFAILVEQSLRGGKDVKGSDAPLQLTSVLRFARKARYFKLAYFALREGADRSHTLCVKDIEDMVKTLQKRTYKNHRGISDKLLNEEE